jgi:archaemetzincin
LKCFSHDHSEVAEFAKNSEIQCVDIGKFCIFRYCCYLAENSRVMKLGISVLLPLLVLSTLAFTCFGDAGTKPAVERSVAIQPFAGLPAEYAEEVKKALETYYGCTVIMLAEIELPDEAYTEEKTPRYRADKLLVFLKEKLPEGCDHVLGLTASDISTTKYEHWATRKIKAPEWRYKDWGIFGLGQMPGSACVVSTHRLKAGANDELLRERLRKVCCHEVGHNLGLPHCTDSEECFMRDGAEKIATVDAESEKLCEVCAKKVGVGE